MMAAAAARRAGGLALDGSAIGAAVELACRLEATAPKPGNVSPGRPFADTTYEDFVASAAAIRAPMAAAGARNLGDTIWLSVEATSRTTCANTNLGIVLLLAPLARAAAQLSESSWPPAVGERMRSWRLELRRVLMETTVDDARSAYRAIRLAHPGGLGSAADQDVAREPTVTLLEAMQRASDRDGIAREYATAFETTFQRGVPALLTARGDGLTWNDALIETFLAILVAAPDTHIARRGGEERARHVSALARDALRAGGVRSEGGKQAIAAMDTALRDARNVANPGTSADLTAAAAFVVLLTGEAAADQPATGELL